MRAKLRHSHIIPEFQFIPLYDPLHRYRILSTIEGRKPRLAQKGVREYLLCHDCEQRFSKWERYAKDVIFGTKLKPRDLTPIGQRMEGLDYKPYRLYLLSILWRMGIAEQQMFEEVHLGEHEPRLREMLLADNPGEPHEYTCFITIITLNSKFRSDWMLQPHLDESQGVRFCRVVINGVLHEFRLSIDPWAVPEDLVVARSGTLVLGIKDASEVPFIYETLRQQHVNLDRI